MRFKSFVLNENKYYLAQKSGDILTALQALEEDAASLGTRALLRATQGVIDQIRRILHGRWDDEDLNYLKTLQRVGVALCNAIDAKDELPEVIASAAQEVEAMTGEMSVPVNDLAADHEAGDEPPEVAPGTDIDA